MITSSSNRLAPSYWSEVLLVMLLPSLISVLDWSFN